MCKVFTWTEQFCCLVAMGFLECFMAIQDVACTTLAAIGYSVELLFALVLNQRNASLGPTPKLMVQPRQLNDSLYELYNPPARPNMQVLLFHGFQLHDYEDAHLFTWKSGDGTCIWPQTWLVEKFPNAQILTVSYNAPLMKRRKSGNVELYIIGENLMSDLLDANIGQQPHCPVILVGHGFGGLAIKELLVHGGEFRRGVGSSSNFHNFLESLKGIFFYSTPHHGISSDIAAHFVTDSPLLEYVKVLSTDAARLNYRFQNLCNEFKTWQIAGLGEGLPIQWGRFHGLVVDEGSSRYGPHFNIVEGADHISICQPKERTSRTFNALTNLLGNIASDSKVGERPGNFQRLLKPIVGIDDVLEDVKRKLTKASSLGFVGMGGIGKSTMAMVLFNAVGSHYDYTCFIKDTKNIEGSVEDAVLAHMYYRGREITGKHGLEFLRGERLLLILDDVASEKDLEMVPTLRDVIVVHEDSRFVATSRDAQLLTLCLTEVYPVSLLSFERSKDLLLTHAFPNEVPPSFEKHIEMVVEKCAGLPLTVEVMGKYLYRKPESIWKQAIEALDKANTVAGFDEKLWGQLKVSYDGLDKVEQDMFLDAVTIFEPGFPLEMAKAFWSLTTEGSEDIRWQHLVDLSLVWERPFNSQLFSSRIKIGMHEQLLSLGRRIALTPGNNGYRICETGVCKKVLEQLSGDDNSLDDFKEIFASILHPPNWDIIEDPLKDVVALSLDYSDLDIAPDSNEDMRSTLEKRISNLLSTLCKPRRLRYLSLSGINIDQTPLPTSLRLLELDDLDVLDLPFNPSNHKLMACLSLGCGGLLTLPATFGQLSSLRILSLHCERLKSLPASFGRLLSLRDLFIICPNLESLPDSFGHLAMLQVLRFGGSRTMRQLPESFGNLKALKFLWLESKVLTRLPDSFGDLAMLKELTLSCLDLRQLPESFGNLKALEILELQCKVLTRLPDSFGDLAMLKELTLSCLDLRQLPESFGNLKALEILELQCKVLTRLPDSFGHLTMLKRVTINYTTLEKLPETFGSLTALEYLALVQCNVLTHLPDSFGHLAMLEHLVISRTPLEKLPETFGNLKALKVVTLDECNDLTGLPYSLGSLPRLEILHVFVCRLLQELPDTFLQLQGLKDLQLLWTSLRTIPNLENLRSLTTLRLHWYEDARFPNLPKCLGEAITPSNYNRNPLDFNVVGGQFIIKRVDNLPLLRWVLSRCKKDVE